MEKAFWWDACFWWAENGESMNIQYAFLSFTKKFQLEEIREETKLRL